VDAWTNTDFFTAVTLGKVPWARRVFFSGNNPDIDPGTEPEDIWPYGGLFSFKTSGGQLELVSASANDTAAGTGARTVRVDFLSTQYAEFSEVIVLNGTTAVPTTRTDILRVNGAVVLTTGSSGRNEGVITIRDVGAGTTRATVSTFVEGGASPGQSFLDQMLYTVPAGHTMLVYSVDMTINRAGANRWVTARIYARSNTGVIRTPKALSLSSDQSYTLSGRMPVPVPERTDWWVRVINASGTNTDVSCSAEAILISNAGY
jgi:hypothetical protein